MKLKICEIILWARKSGVPPRRVSFALDKVNVISGASKTGKSAIIPIIDYCLGSDRCAIPVETIRNACSWFGILVETEEGQKLLARREPGGQKSTGDMFMLEGKSIDVPAGEPVKNTTADAVKTRLDELSGLSKLNFDFEGTGSGFKGRPSFRDLVAFIFQPQNIVANPDVLFFKADTFEHREKLKTIFPYVLKAVSAATLAAQHELLTLQREVARKERELTNMRQVSDRWMAELRSWATQARELGLVSAPIPQQINREGLLELLKNVITDRKPTQPSADGISEAMQELVALEAEEATVDTQLRTLRRRFAEMSKLRENAGRMTHALHIQRDRLALSKWLSSLKDTGQTCPICDNPIVDDGVLGELLASLRTIEDDVQRSGSAPLSFDREIVRVKDEVRVCVEKLEAIGARKADVGARSAEAQQARFGQSAIARFIGRVEKGLEIHQSLGEDSALADEVANLRKKEQELKRQISKEDVASRTRRALDKIAVFAGRLLPGLDSERPDDPVELSISDLTIKVKGADREDYLWEIGSGANWLSYHVAMSLALQQFFQDSEPNPVPSLLVYDQPSQVYFPRRAAAVKAGEKDLDPKLQDEDIDAVRKVFETIASVVKAGGGALQTLILDHAGSDVWGSVSGVHLVEEWRGGNKLIPKAWIE